MRKFMLVAFLEVKAFYRAMQHIAQL